MKINWSFPRSRDDLAIPSGYLRKDVQTQNRRELTFLMQEAAFVQKIPIYCVIDVDLLEAAQKELFACDEFSCKSTILLGMPVREMMLYMEQTVPGLTCDRKDTMAQLKVKNYLMDFAEKLEIQGYHTKKLMPDVFPDETFASMLAVSGKGYVGLNKRFVTEDYGSRMCIGILLTDAPLMGGDYRYADYAGNGCGDCRKCIKACPAGAFSEGEFDREKCIAWRDDPENQQQIAEHSTVKCMKCMECCESQK